MLFRGFSALSKRVSSLGRHSIFNSTNNASAGINKKKMSSDNSIISNEDKMEGQGGMGRLKEDIILVIIIIILQAGEIRSQWGRQWMEVHIFQVVHCDSFPDLGLGRCWYLPTNCKLMVRWENSDASMGGQVSDNVLDCKVIKMTLKPT